MPPKRNFSFLMRPDFSSIRRYQELGWMRVGVYDLPAEGNGKAGSLIPHESSEEGERIGTFTIYENERSGTFAFTLNVFDQELALTVWWQKNIKDSPYGAAIRIDDTRWMLKKPNEMWDLLAEAKCIAGKKTIHKVTLMFYCFRLGRRENTFEREVIRKP